MVQTPIRKQIVKEQRGHAYQTQTSLKQNAQVVIAENWAAWTTLNEILLLQ